MICGNPHMPIKVVKEREMYQFVHKTSKDYNEGDRKKIEKNQKDKTILLCGIRPNEYNCVSTCESIKEIQEASHKTHDGTNQVNKSKIGMLNTQYGFF